MQFLFLTKTRWDEPPRLRHQLARLLAGAGHEVLFVEKPGLPGQRLPERREAEGRIALLRHHDVLHPKLRLSPLVHRLNAWIVRNSLRRMLAGQPIGPHTVVVNFNYDYWFLRELFPAQRLITIINDDFVSGALFGYTQPLLWALSRTCAMSDRVLTLSALLQTQLASYCAPELFLPWTDHGYRAPAAGARDTLLFWGFVNTKVDFTLLRQLADRLLASGSSYRLMIVGPVEQGVDGDLAELAARANVEIRPAAELESLPLDRVLAGFIPYRDRPDVDAIALPNKALRLLACGMPLLITGMPHFIRAPFVFRLSEPGDITVLDAIAAQFAGLQPVIADFVAANAPPARLTQFLQLAS